jgi:hypothetical protein
MEKGCHFIVVSNILKRMGIGLILFFSLPLFISHLVVYFTEGGSNTLLFLSILTSAVGGIFILIHHIWIRLIRSGIKRELYGKNN